MLFRSQLAIEDAQGEVDGYLGLRFPVPLTPPVPKLVMQLTRNAAAYYADIIYRQGTDYDSELDPVYLRYRRSVELLEKISKGELALDLDENPTTPPVEAEGIVVNKYAGDLFTIEDFALFPDGSAPRGTGWF